jgi:hypothetical protein
MGMLVSRRRRGACVALQWQASDGVYRCAMVGAPRQVLQALPQPWRWLFFWMARPAAWLAKRWIAAGTGCDSTLELATSSTMQASPIDHFSSPTHHD